MKRLLFVASLCATTLTYTTSKNDLASAIRSLDVATVQQIIASEKFTQREYDRYIDLADEMIRNREPWLTRMFPLYDEATPYEGPSLKRLIPEGFLGYISILGIVACLAEFGDALSRGAGKKYDERGVWLVGATLSFAVAGKCICDIKKRLKADKTYKELLRKKYEDAVTIKQLIYTANIVEA